ncbi:SDR family NAD(P)-dependent oxidoreductase [Mycolicibacterium thermoresistibile]
MDRQKFDRLFDMTDRTVIVTGGTRGIGLALAEGYVLAGARVVVASRSPDACESAAAQLRAMGGEVIGVPTDLGDLDTLEALVARTVEEFGGIDVLVNNAAISIPQRLGEVTVDRWTETFGVNLRGPVFLTQAALPQLKASAHAAVLNLLTVGAFKFSTGVSAYVASKAALMSYTQSMAAEFAPFDIRVNALVPGPVNTDLMRGFPQKRIDAIAETTLQKRLADPDELVGSALLLTSDAGSYLTGQALIVDGGGTPR